MYDGAELGMILYDYGKLLSGVDTGIQFKANVSKLGPSTSF